ncbi:MAG TPA: hypothetical protein VFA74_03575 [Terriglobales bacterium]|nr:hypothetical protein [Terriglobales bacterium]
MTREIDKEIMELCGLIANEQDAGKFRELSIRLHDVLEKKNKRLEEKGAISLPDSEPS